MTTVISGSDGRTRCWWGSGDTDYEVYHDTEWGFPQGDDIRLFEKVCLEGFQAGLSWLTILRKRDNFRTAFSGFDPQRIADYGEDDVLELLDNAGIIRHRGKIEATINNAGRALDLQHEFGTLASYFWGWEPERGPAPSQLPAVTDVSTALSKDLKRRGWKFVGPTTMYAFMQAMGMVNDHLGECWVREAAEESRSQMAVGIRQL